MLTQRAEAIARFTRNDAVRLAIAAGILIAVLTAILGSDILPQPTLTVAAGDLAPRDIIAPRALDFVSESRTVAAREAAAQNVPPQYDFTSEKAIALANEQQVAFEQRVQRVDTAFSADITADQRTALLQVAVSGLTDASQAALIAMDPGRWSVVRTESARVLDALLRAPLLDTEVAVTRTRLAGLMAGGLDAKERGLAAELIGPLVVPNSSFSQGLTDQETAKAIAAVQPVMVSILQGEKIVPAGERVTPEAMEKITALGLADLQSRRHELLRLVPAGRPDRRAAARLAVAVPPDPLAPRQRPGPDRAPRRGSDARRQDHGRPLDPAVLPADRRRSGCCSRSSSTRRSRRSSSG